MANNPKFSTGFRNSLLDATEDISTLFDGGELHIYSGTQPTDADATEGAGTLLAEVALPGSNAFAASASGGSIAKNGTWTINPATATGTAAWFRLYQLATETGASATYVRIDGTCGTSAADLVLSTLSIDSADTVTIDTFSIAITA